MAHRHHFYEGSSSDEGWARNTSSFRPARKNSNARLSWSEEESDNNNNNRTFGFFGGGNTSSDSDRYQSASEYESSDSDRRRSSSRFYNKSSSDDDYFSEGDDDTPSEFTSFLWRRVRPRSILGAAFACGMALTLPSLIDRNNSSIMSSSSFGKISKLPKYMMDSVYYTASSLIPGSSSTRRMEVTRPDFVYEHPYVSSSYYTSTNNTKVLLA
jgi:hypothetical protein